MIRKAVTSVKAPSPIGPYSQAIETGELLFISGQICINPVTGQLRNASLEEETHQVMQNLQAILSEAGMTFDNVVKTTIFITDMSRFSELNGVYGKYFTNYFPARETVQVSALPRSVNVEISMIAAR